jgi:transcriptional regulator with XRE-family HTH domain
MNKLSSFVENKRKDLALTQVEYAEKLGISTPTLVNIEGGKKVGMRTLKKLAEYYNLSTKLVRRMMLIEDNEQEQLT